MQSILVLGCSFTYGHGCSDRPDSGQVIYRDQPASKYCWASIMAQRLEASHSVFNLSFCGRSNSEMFLDLISFLQSHRPQVVILNATQTDRILMSIDGSEQVKSWGPYWESSVDLENYSAISEAKKQYTTYMYNSLVGRCISYSAIWAIIGLCKELGIRYLVSWPKLIEEQQTFVGHVPIESRFTSIIDYDFRPVTDQHRQCLTANKHTSQLGHSIYYKLVIETEVLPRVLV